MRLHSFLKMPAALATMASMVALLASPAVGDPFVTGGTLSIGDPPFVSFPLGGDTEDPPCDAQPNAGTFEVGVSGDNLAGSWTTAGGFAGLLDLLGSWYKTDFTLSAMAGSYTHAGGDDWNITGGGTLGIDIYEVVVPDPPDPEEPCEKAEFVCTILVDLVLIMPSAYTGSWPPGPGGTILVNAVSVPPHIRSFPQCPLIWSVIHGTPMSIVDLTIDL